MAKNCSAQEIADALGAKYDAVVRRATREMWPSNKVSGRGRGGSRVYIAESLPDDVRLALRRKEIERETQTSLVLKDVQLPADSGGGDSEGLTPEEINLCMKKAALVQLYRNHKKKVKKWGRMDEARENFAAAYNLGERGSFPNLFRDIGETSWKTIERWHVILRDNNEDPLALADRRGRHRRGKQRLTEEQQKIVIPIALSPNQLKTSEIIRAAKARMDVEGISHPQSDGTFRNWINEFQRDHYDKWVFYRHGAKALNEECLPHIERDWDRIQVGDIIFADGHKLNFKVIHPGTGKPMRMMLVAWMDAKSNYIIGYEISPTENIQAIASALHRAILCLGKIPKIAYMDNGKAFRGKFFSRISDFAQTELPGLFKMLGMETIYAWPYHGESKTVERFFGTFSELERKSPSFVGTSIEGKPPHLLRGEKLHKLLHEYCTQSRVPTIEDAYTAIASWLDEYQIRPQRGHLNGRCPQEVFDKGKGPGLTEEELTKLRLLMMNVTVRGVKRDGITLPGSKVKYHHRDLHARKKQTVIVRYDWFDKSQIYVYDEHGKFICTAKARNKVHPAADYLGTEEERAELKKQIELRKSLEKQTTGPARQFLETVILPEEKRRQELSGFGEGAVPAAPSTKSKDDLPEEKEAPRVPMTKEQEEAYRQALDDYERREAEKVALDPTRQDYDPHGPDLEEIHGEEVWNVLDGMDEFTRYRELLRLEVRGVAIPLEFKKLMYYFEQGDLYQSKVKYFRELKLKWMYGRQMMVDVMGGAGLASSPD